MNAGTRGWIALAGVGAVMLTSALIAVVVTPVPLTPSLYLIGLLAFPVVGGLVVVHQPDNLIGRLLVLGGFFNAVGGTATTLTLVALEAGAPPPDPASWLAVWVYWPAVPLMPLITALFPSGSISSRWLRPVLWVAGTMTFVLTLAVMFQPGPVNPALLGDLRNPWTVDSLTGWVSVGDVLLPYLVTALMVLATGDLVVRWRRSKGVVRLQMRWLGLGLLLVAALAIIVPVMDRMGLANDLVLVMLWLSFGALPASIGVAVTRYRLFEIDRLLSRTLTYGLVVGVLAGVYVGGVLLLGLVLPARSDLAVAAVTLTVAALFTPLRRRVQVRVDRRFNRSRYDAARMVDAFGARLRDRLDLDDVTADLLAVVAGALQPSSAAVWVRGRRP
jgi:hypothetical protein